MHTEQRQQTIALLKEQGLDYALFANRESVTWLTGFMPPVQLGLNHFAGAPPLVWYADEHFYLIILDSYAEQAAPFDAEADGTVLKYEGYSIQHPIISDVTLIEILKNLTGSAKGKIGVELQTTPALVTQSLPASASLHPIDKLLIRSRMIKTAEELVKLRENFRLTNVGHAAARQSLKAGMREIDLWANVQAAINGAAEERIPLGNDLVVGTRSPNNIGGWPLGLEIKEGDSVIVDLSTGYKGYWSDSCATYYVSERTAEQEKVHQFITEALDYAISLIRPKVSAGEVDAKVRAFIEKAGYPVYPHHTGHGMGTGLHEEPRIVPYNNDMILEAGMVIMLEPAVYFPGNFGVRLEDGMLITSDGVEILTHHDKS